MADWSHSRGRGGRASRDLVAEEEHRLRPLSGGSDASHAWEMVMLPNDIAVCDDFYPPASGPYLVPSLPAGRRRPNIRAPAPFSPRTSAGTARFFFEPPLEEEGRHFLDACTLCRKPLGKNRDIFMYRGDVPFCSEECRQEQIDRDDARERSLGGARKASPRKASSSSSSSSPEQQGICVPAAGAIVAG